MMASNTICNFKLNKTGANLDVHDFPSEDRETIIYMMT